jgi:hypothetical protein
MSRTVLIYHRHKLLNLTFWRKLQSGQKTARHLSHPENLSECLRHTIGPLPKPTESPLHFYILLLLDLSIKWHLRLPLPNCSFLSGFPPIHRPAFDGPTDVWRRVQIMKLLIIPFSLSSFDFLPLSFRQYFQCPICKHPHSAVSSKLRNQILLNLLQSLNSTPCSVLLTVVNFLSYCSAVKHSVVVIPDIKSQQLTQHSYRFPLLRLTKFANYLLLPT